MTNKFLDDCYNAIKDQPAAISRTLDPVNRPITFNRILNASRIFLIGTGDSYVVSLFGSLAFTQLGLNAHAYEAVDALQIPFRKGDALIAISASGRSTQLIQAVKRAVKADIETFGLTENPKGALSELVDNLLLTQAHPRTFNISPSSTTTSALALLMLLVDEYSRIEHSKHLGYTQILEQKANSMLKWSESWGKRTANEIKTKNVIYFLGIGPTCITAMLGMMKIHEYAVSKGIAMHMEEFAHHTKLVVNKGDPVILLPLKYSSSDEYYKMLTIDIRKILKADLFVIQQPSIDYVYYDFLESIFLIFPLQFLAYYIAKTHEPPILGWRAPHASAFKIYKDI